MNRHPFDRLSAALAILVISAGVMILGQQAGWWAPTPEAAIGAAVCALALATMIGWPRSRPTEPLHTQTPGQAINNLPGGDS